MPDDRTQQYFQQTGAPTREEFDRAAKEVMESAPPGLSREQFFDAIDRRISNNRPKPEPTLKGFASNLVGNAVEMPGQALQGILKAFSQDPGKTVTDVGAGLRDKAKAYYKDPLKTIYDKPADFLADVATAGQGARMVDSILQAPAKIRGARAAAFNEQPLYKQMEKLPGGGGSGSSGSSTPPRGVPPSSTPPRPTGPELTSIPGRSWREPITLTRQDLVSPLHDDPTMVTPGEEAAYNATRDKPKFRSPDDVAFENLSKRLNMAQEMPEPASHGPHGAQDQHLLEGSPWLADEDWHSGAEPGSAEAQSAHGMHRYQGEMDAGYERRIADDRGAVPAGLFITLAKMGLMKGLGVPGGIARAAVKSIPYIAEPAIDTGLISRIVNNK